MAKRTWTIESLTEACKESSTIAQVLNRLGLRPTGGNYSHIKKCISREKIDISHFTFQAWSKDKMLLDWSEYKRPNYIKNHLLRERGNICENCKLDKWCDIPITIEVHHIDGNRINNQPHNLQLLCPNCHALTDNWRGRVSKKK
jgi:hypothetical protein